MSPLKIAPPLNPPRWGGGSLSLWERAGERVIFIIHCEPWLMGTPLKISKSANLKSANHKNSAPSQLPVGTGSARDFRSSLTKPL